MASRFTETSPGVDVTRTARLTPVHDTLELVVALDTMVAGVHFFTDTGVADVAYKALAVNLSDLAAMGATPKDACFALTVPDARSDWAQDFVAALHTEANRFAVALGGACITAGPLCVSIEVCGHVPRGEALTRSGAAPGDAVFVTGTLGDAGLALAAAKGEVQLAPDAFALTRTRLTRPEPRVAMGIALRRIASAAIDLSDGLSRDLGHLADASGAGARIDVGSLPLSQSLQQSVSLEQAWHYALASGDDYELCFTVPESRLQSLATLALQGPCPIQRIGTIEARSGIRFCAPAGVPFNVTLGYQHFSPEPDTHTGT